MMKASSDSVPENVQIQALESLRKTILTGMIRSAGMISEFLHEGFDCSLQDAGAYSPTVLARRITRDEQTLAGVHLTIHGQLTGSLLMLFSTSHASQLIRFLLRQTHPVDLNVESQHSALKEVGNIFTSRVLSNLEEQIGLRALPEPPMFLSGTWDQVQQLCQEGTGDGGIRVQGHLSCASPAGCFEGIVLLQARKSLLGEED
ncbi:MAG: hypothetical protein C0618_10135 [Desulfuromonas sp.]|nr:MAG: hypothetical protein C0618_10135 [Desulfuromonas sp.]